ncbi:MAG TPA: Crp/Fnr family transcriptional regulator [Coriobacteriia bacterium]|nr:Crp/Fnr family transcriptional regulator [Coriobacteriia bacterium]
MGTGDLSSARLDVRAALRECRLWRGASEGAIDALAAAARVEDLPRGASLFAEGQPADRFGVIVSGRVHVYHLGADGRRIIFETLAASEPVGVVVALAGGRYPAHAETVTPVSIAWLTRAALFELLAAEPDIARSLIADLANRVVAFTSVVQTLALDVPARLSRYLFQRALAVGTPSPRGLEVDLGMRKSDLAAALGTVPETLSRAFAKLRDEGLVEVHGARVTVLDVRALAAMGSGYSEE